MMAGQALKLHGHGSQVDIWRARVMGTVDQPWT